MVMHWNRFEPSPGVPAAVAAIGTGCNSSWYLWPGPMARFLVVVLSACVQNPPSLWFLGEISRAFGALVCLQDFPFSFAILDLQGRGDYVLEHLNPAGLPPARRI